MAWILGLAQHIMKIPNSVISDYRGNLEPLDDCVRAEGRSGRVRLASSHRTSTEAIPLDSQGKCGGWGGDVIWVWTGSRITHHGSRTAGEIFLFTLCSARGLEDDFFSSYAGPSSVKE